jgi:hypothetical protein
LTRPQLFELAGQCFLFVAVATNSGAEFPDCYFVALQLAFKRAVFAAVLPQLLLQSCDRRFEPLEFFGACSLLGAGTRRKARYKQQCGYYISATGVP